MRCSARHLSGSCCACACVWQGKGSGKSASAATKVSESDRQVLQLKMQRDKMNQQRKKVLAVMARETEIAKELLREGRKDRAKLALKKRKLQEKMLENHERQMLKMEQMIEGVEEAQRQKRMFEVPRAPTPSCRRAPARSYCRPRHPNAAPPPRFPPPTGHADWEPGATPAPTRAPRPAPRASPRAPRTPLAASHALVS